MLGLFYLISTIAYVKMLFVITFYRAKQNKIKYHAVYNKMNYIYSTIYVMEMTIVLQKYYKK